MSTPPTRRDEVTGAAVLLGVAAVALAWANSPWDAAYRSLWRSGGLHHAVNSGVMAVFFLVVGLQIKQELVTGDLREPRTATMPILAAAGGMAVPALLYLVVAGPSGRHGWGVPMATDIAFATGLLALVGSRVPASLKLFLLTLAVVDDIGAIAVIAVFYTSGLKPALLLVALAIVAAIAVVRRVGVTWWPLDVALGLGLWLATDASGVHATIAGVVFGLLMPAGRAEPIERRLRPWTTFVVLPIFALANAGVRVRADVFGAPGAAAVTAAVVVGLVVGKLVGITGAARLAAATGVGRQPAAATWPMVGGIAAVGGIGFTVSLFVAQLAFPAGPLQDAAKLGVLVASALAAALGSAVLGRASP